MKRLVILSAVCCSSLIALSQTSPKSMGFEEYEPKSTLVVPQHPVTHAKFPFFDVHNHQWDVPTQDLKELFAQMDKLNMAVMNNLSGKSYKESPGRNGGFDVQGHDYLVKSIQHINSVNSKRLTLFTNLSFVVYKASHPQSNKNWWDFTGERKKYRAKNGYPKNRPTRPWYDLPAFRKEKRVPVRSAAAQKDIAANLKNAMTYIKKNYTENISLDRLATVACQSPSHFQRNFKAVYEQSPLEFITHLRLKKACQLLKKTRLPIGDITLRSGFDDASSFIRLFKKHFGTTPALFRKAHLMEALTDQISAQNLS